MSAMDFVFVLLLVPSWTDDLFARTSTSTIGDITESCWDLLLPGSLIYHHGLARYRQHQSRCVSHE
eukprot:scaffold616749_cov15-Prasinocladus_malaysianus.AAC.1